MAKRKRKVLLWAGIVLLALVTVVAALPLWFPWVLRPILQRYGIRYADCQRIGYRQFALRKVSFARGNTKIEAQRVEALVPTVWLWQLYLNRGESPTAWARVSDWRLDVTRKAGSAPNSSNSSAYATMRQVESDLSVLKKWLPRADLTNGIIGVEGRSIILPSANWDVGKVAARLLEPKSGRTGILQVDARTNLSWQASLRVDSLDIDSQLLIAEDAGNVRLTGTAFWRSNRLDLAARIGRQGWIPEQGTVTSKSFRVPAGMLQLKGYDDLSGSLDGRWENGRFAVDVNAAAKPLTNAAVPPVQAAVRATGDTQAVTIETADIKLPWLSSHFSGGAKLDYRGRLLSPEVVVSIAADLAKQPWVALTGNLEGEAHLRQGPDGYPATSFKVSGARIAGRGVQTKAVTVSGELGGPWRNLAYSAHTEIDGLNTRGLTALQIQADVHGHGETFEYLNARLTAGESTLVIAGSGGRAAQRIDLRIDTLELNKAGESEFKLSKPFVIYSEQPSGGIKTQPPWVVNVEAFRWEGDGRELTLETRFAWPATGSISSSARGIDPSLFQDFFPKPLPRIRFGEFAFSGAWTNGPMFYDVGLTARLLESGAEPFLAELKAVGSAKGLSVQHLAVSTASETVVSGQGIVPLTIEPGRAAGIFNLEETQPISFSASTRPNAAFWNEIAALAGIRLQEPRLDLTISGTLKTPQGKVTATAKGIELLKYSLKGLRVENLAADLTLADRRAKLDQFRMEVQGQPITATGEFPWTGKYSGSFKTMVDLNQSTARLTVTEAQLGALAPLFPEALAPQGRLSVEMSLRPGEQFDGSLTIVNAATQPLGTMGAFLDVNAQLKFVGHGVVIQTFTGFLGGGRLNIAGGADLEPMLQGKLPQFDMKVDGENVPLVRQPDVIVRSDVNVTLTNPGEGEPMVSGTMKLRNGFYLKDLAELIPGEVSRPEQRPPFFSVSAEPLANWRVNLAVTGTNAVKVRTPYFNGAISVDFKVHGTLREPVAVGEARIASGTILFPFTNLQVKQGLISLYSDNPFVPQLFVTAASRTFGYDVRMEISGPATQPKIEFTSTPPLTSEQVLLMVTAGVLPQGESSFTTQQRAQQLAVFLGKSFLSKFGSTGDSDRLTIRSGEYLTQQGVPTQAGQTLGGQTQVGETYSLEYRLSRTLSIVGEYNQFEELVFSLKWKVYSK